MAPPGRVGLLPSLVALLSWSTATAHRLVVAPARAAPIIACVPDEASDNNNQLKREALAFSLGIVSTAALLHVSPVSPDVALSFGAPLTCIAAASVAMSSKSEPMSTDNKIAPPDAMLVVEETPASVSASWRSPREEVVEEEEHEEFASEAEWTTEPSVTVVQSNYGSGVVVPSSWCVAGSHPRRHPPQPLKF